jgi:[ribosomal protein S5]-alanine N-acetyltransferase
VVNIELRKWTYGDAGEVLRAFQADDMRTQTSWPIITLKDAEGWIAAWEGVGYAFAVMLDGRVAGNVAITNVDAHLNGWVSYWTAADRRGIGVATAATGLIAEWAFTERGLFRLVLNHWIGNTASCRVAVKAGFPAEGVERGRLLYDGVRHDVERHARLATD